MPITSLNDKARIILTGCLIVLTATVAFAGEPERDNKAPTGIPDPSIATSFPDNGDSNGTPA